MTFLLTGGYMKNEKKFTIIICCIFVLFAGYFYLNSGTSSVPDNTNVIKTSKPLQTIKPDSDESNSKGEIAVYICGAIKHPGVYKFSTASRVCDVISAAGGFNKNAATTYVNQARFLTDGEQITIPTKKQLKSNPSQDKKPSDSSSQSDSSDLLNINQATESELMTLAGVGQSKAASIIAYRNEHGNFAKKEDIMNVSGIKEGVYNKIKDKITV